MLEAARLRQIDLVLVLRLDRWGRFVADCVDTLRPLTSYGVAWLASLPGAQHGGRRDRLLELKAAGKSWEAISRELGVPVGTLRNALPKPSPGTALVST